ncbi:site-specific integrase [Chitinophagaceae bacterium 26-R-25]|nr:site-specific integrase [Chitinophagaceae bacterium 26-R-25]
MIREKRKEIIMSVTIATVLDTRRIKENNKYPVKLRLNFARTTNYYQTIFDLSQEDYNKLSAPHISSELQAIKNKIKKIEHEAEAVVSKLESFSFSEFESKFIASNKLFRQRKRKQIFVHPQTDDFDFSPYHKKFSILQETIKESGSIAWSFRKYVQKLIKEGRISTAVSYHCSYVSLKKFRGDIKFISITTSYLVAYEQELKTQGISRSTIGIYLRSLRAVYNEAVEDGFAKKDKSYPFGRRKYQIPTARKVKKALDLKDVEMIYYYDESRLSEFEQRSKAYWLFSYFGNGMNIKDIACLKYQNVHDDYLIFERAKTERSLREDPKPITIFLNEDMKYIISRWGNKPVFPNEYIFPILHHGITPLRQYTLIQNLVGVINDCMQRILADLNIDKKATTYVARHTFSTILKRAGASTEQIQEALGHTNIRTTESYLDCFANDTKKLLSSKLSAFKK